MKLTDGIAGALRRRWLPLGAVVLVPFAFAGFVVGALAGADEAIDRVPAALVNEDELLYQTGADGAEAPVFAGRGLVTELVADRSFDWTITNAEAADRALADGEVHAILTIPSDFSKSIVSMSGEEPRRASIDIRTDDAHSYLTGTLSETLGASMARAFGQTITAQYISGIYSGMGTLGKSLGDAAQGAGELSDGVSGISSGLTDLASGVSASQAGAARLSGGIDQYTRGVDALSGGLASLRDGASGLRRLSAGVSTYTGQIEQLSTAIAAVTADLAADPSDPVALATLDQLSQNLAAAAAGGATLSQQVAGGVAGVQGGIADSASGAARLAAGSAGLRSGSSSLAQGLGQLSSGAGEAANGAAALSDGASDLASGLATGAESVPALDESAQASAAEVAADPVTVSINRDNPIAGVTQALAAFLVPLGLWVGALATFLVWRPMSFRMLGSSARSGRLLADQLGRAGLISLAQATLLVGLLHGALDVPWSLLPATFGFAVVTAAAFTAFHHLLTTVFGRAGLLVSLFAVAVQVTATGGLYPIQLVSGPFQAISPLLPLTHAVTGMQAIIAGGGAAPALAAGLVLLGFGALSALLALVAIRRNRRASSLRLAAAWEGVRG